MSATRRHTGKMTNAFGIFVGRPEGSDRLGDLLVVNLVVGFDRSRLQIGSPIRSSTCRSEENCSTSVGIIIIPP